MDTCSILHRRRTIRRYTEQPVDRAQIDELIAAATRAPSPHNRQPWRFAVILGEARVRLAGVMGGQLRADLQRDNVAGEAIERDVARSCRRITSAPVCILACLSMAGMDVYADERRNEAERWMAGQAVAAAIQNILLRATELGLGACWMCAPLFCQAAVSAAIPLPADWRPQALITIGHPADAGRQRERREPRAISIVISL